MHRIFKTLPFLGLFVVLQTVLAVAQNTPAPNRAHIVDMPLADVISWFEQQNDVIVRVDDVPTHTAVRATTVDFGNPEFLIWLRQKFDVEYYQHGRTIYLNSGKENTNRVVYLEYLTVEDVRTLLTGYEIHSSTPISGQNSLDGKNEEVVILTGPDSYIEISEALIARAERERAVPPIRVSVMRAGIRTGETRINQNIEPEQAEASQINAEEE